MKYAHTATFTCAVDGQRERGTERVKEKYDVLETFRKSIR